MALEVDCALTTTVVSVLGLKTLIIVAGCAEGDWAWRISSVDKALLPSKRSIGLLGDNWAIAGAEEGGAIVDGAPIPLGCPVYIPGCCAGGAIAEGGGARVL